MIIGISSLLNRLNLHEGKRSKPTAWISVGFLPVYNDNRAKGLRLGSGYESIRAKKIRLFRRCWIEFLDGWEEKTRNAIMLPWGDGVQRLTNIFFGGLLGDQQEGDKYTAEPVVCHRCTSASTDFLNPHAPAHPKTMKCMRLNVEAAASGAHLKGSRGKWVVKWTQVGATCVLGQVPDSSDNVSCILLHLQIFRRQALRI